MISKKLFVDSIEAIQHQMYQNRLIEEAFNVKESAISDNSGLIKAIIQLLQSYFPPENNFCSIEFYIQTNFGKYEQVEYMSPEELYDTLIVQYQ